MSEEKEKRVETPSVKGAWDVKYKWRFDVGMMEKYVEGLKDKKILGTHCPDCNRVYAPPTPLCGKCYRLLSEWVEVKDEAALVMYTVGYTSITGETYKEPNITAMIRFEGSDSWFLASVRGVKPENIKIGMKLKPVWREDRRGKLGDIDYFAPAE